MYKKAILVVYSVLLVLLTFACISFAKKADEVIIAKVNGEVITQSELYYYINKYANSDEVFKGGGGKRKFLDKLVEFKMMLAVSKKYGEDKNPKVRQNYENHLLKRYADEFKKNLILSMEVSLDEIEKAFSDNGNDETLKTDEEINAFKEKIKDHLLKNKYSTALHKELEELKKRSKIIVHDEVIDKLDKGEDVEAAVTILQIDDEEISYDRVKSLIPQNIRHSSESSKKKRAFLTTFLDQVIELFLYANEAKRKKITDSQVYFNLSNNEYYDKLLVNMLDQNETFLNDVYGDILVTDEEIKESYDKIVSDVGNKRPYVKVKNLTFANKEDAELALQDAKNGVGFEEIRKKHSEKIVKANMAMGQFSKESLEEQFGAKFSEELKNMEVGHVSDLIKRENGYLIAILAEKKGGVDIAPLEDLKDEIIDFIRTRKSKISFEKYFKEVKKSSKVSINEALFEKVKMSR